MKTFYLFYESGPIQMILGIEGTELKKIACFELDGKEVCSRVRVTPLKKRTYSDHYWQEFEFDYKTSLFDYQVLVSFVNRNGQFEMTYYRSKHRDISTSPWDALILTEPDYVVQARSRLNRNPVQIEIRPLDTTTVEEEIHNSIQAKLGLGA